MLRSLSLLACLWASVPTVSAGDAVPPVVYTTFYPTTYFAQRIAGEHVKVVCPVAEDADPIFWRPDRDVMAQYLAADLVILNGAQFEKWVLTADLPRRSTIDTAQGFRERWLEFDTGVTHSHGNEGQHTHKGVDGHTWLDPLQARDQAAAVLVGLKRVVPDATADLDARFAELVKDLEDLDRRFRALGTLADGETLVASHPAYNYLARRYGWRVVNADLDPEQVPDDEALAAIAAQLAAGGKQARYMLWESEPLPAAAARVKERLGLESVLFSPCEMLAAEARAKGADYLSVMRDNAARLAVAFPARPTTDGD